MKLTLSHGNIYLSKLSNGGWYIDSIMVDHDYRNRGIGTRLMRKALMKCNTPIYLLASSELGGDYTKLLAFYESFGFQFVKRQKDKIEFNYNMVLY